MRSFASIPFAQPGTAVVTPISSSSRGPRINVASIRPYTLAFSLSATYCFATGGLILRRCILATRFTAGRDLTTARVHVHDTAFPPALSRIRDPSCERTALRAPSGSHTRPHRTVSCLDGRNTADLLLAGRFSRDLAELLLTCRKHWGYDACTRSWWCTTTWEYASWCTGQAGDPYGYRGGLSSGRSEQADEGGDPCAMTI